VAYAYLRSGCAARFKDYMRTHLADRVRLVTRADVLRRDWLAGEERHTHVGVHGGRSGAEMRVPLVVAPRPVD